MSQTSEQVLEQVSRIVAGVLNKDSVALKPDTRADQVEDWDSLNHIELVVAIEKHFKIKFNFAELQKFKNVGEMCDNIATKLAKPS